MPKVKKSCQLNINSKEWFQARCREAKRCLVNEIPYSKRVDAEKACCSSHGNPYCLKNSKGTKNKRAPRAANDIQNRPEELRGLPDYGHLPRRSFQIDLKASVGEFLANDLFDLDGNQPIEAKIMELTGGVIGVNPSQGAISFYDDRGDTFQMINVVVCCYAFEERDGALYGLPYHISLRPGQKRGVPSEVSVDWIEKVDLSAVLEGNPHYMGFNPFSNAFGLYGIGPLPINESICSDTIGIVYNTYFLASNYDKNDVTDPGMCTSLLGENAGALKDYKKFRFKNYFKKFESIEPLKIWGCDSPIELFLLQAMNYHTLKPKIQTYIFADGTTFPTLHEMWESGKKTKSLSRIITEADFYFEKEKVAVFCDSVEHHSSEADIAKDSLIDQKLKSIGVESIRLTGPEIVRSPLESAEKVANLVSSRQ